MLATSQEQIEMRMTLANAETRTVQMNNQLKKIDDIVDKTEKLLYQMIPQNVAERLRKGVNPMDTVEVFESVTMLFSGMFNFMIGILLVGSSDSFTNIKFRIYNFLMNIALLQIGLSSSKISVILILKHQPILRLRIRTLPNF